MKSRPEKPEAKISEEYVGDEDRAFRIKGSEFPLIFLSKRFADFGWVSY